MAEIPLTQGRVAIVDDADFEWLGSLKWCAHGRGRKAYACRREKGKMVLMHRMILPVGLGEEIDHVDGDRLNNTRANLRACTRSQNNANQPKKPGGSTPFKGVSFNHGRYRARIQVARIVYKLGWFDTAVEAALAYDAAARQHFGPFARLNFPEGLAA
jgi:hypothetical protein